MRTAWNELSLENRIKFSKNAKDFLRKTIIRAYLEAGDAPYTPSNKELAEKCRIPEHTVKRYLKYWKERGVLTSTTRRFLHPIFGWCNQRTLEVAPIYVVAARKNIEQFGKVL